MAKVHVCNVLVLDNPTQFMSKLEFEITFECIEDLPEDLEWKIIYVGSAESEEYDQILDTVYVGPVPEGRHKFVFTADPPNPHKIPVSDVVGVTVILITCAYRGHVSSTYFCLLSKTKNVKLLLIILHGEVLHTYVVECVCIFIFPGIYSSWLLCK